jgi:hypothetical protein
MAVDLALMLQPWRLFKVNSAPGAFYEAGWGTAASHGHGHATAALAFGLPIIRADRKASAAW